MPEDTQTKEPTLIERMEAQRLTIVQEWDGLIKARDAEREAFKTRTATDEFKALPAEQRDAEITAFEDAEAVFRAASDRHEARLSHFDSEVRQRETIETRLDQAARSSIGRVEITDEALTYRRDNQYGQNGLSYYRDLAMVLTPINLQTGGTRDKAEARLVRHAQEMEVEMPKRSRAAEQRARKQVEQAEFEFLASMNLRMRDAKVDRLLAEMRTGGLKYNPFEQRVTPNTADGQGGYFVPPVWLIDEFIPGLRAHLIVAGFPRQMDIPPGTNSINIPKLQTLTSVGYQQVNNAGLPSTDWTDTAVTANVKTLGGYSDVALQLLEQSPGHIVDEVVTTDLMAARNKFLDGEIISGDGTNAGTLNGGHLQGLYNGAGGSAWSGVNTVTYTDGSPAGSHLAPGVFGPMASKIAVNRFDIQNYRIACHGSRWFWYSTSLDTNGRPLGETANGGPFNIQARIQSGLQAEGLVGTLPYIADAPVYVDDNIPTADTTGGGSNQDIAIAGNWDDAWLFQSPLRTDVFREVLSATMGVRFRVYQYAAFLIRYGQSFAVASGSGFARPSTGYGDYFR